MSIETTWRERGGSGHGFDSVKIVSDSSSVAVNPSLVLGERFTLFLQLFNLVEYPNEAFAKRRQRVLDPWRNLGVTRLFENSVPDQLHETLIQDFRGEAVCGSFQLAGATDALSNLPQDMERPFAADTFLEDFRDAWFRVVR